MSERRPNLGLVGAFVAVGGLTGWLSGPALSRSNYVVQAAERVWLEESGKLSESALQSDAFRTTGLPSSSLYQQARDIRAQFQRGGLFFGLWCGLAAGMSVAAVFAERRRKNFEPDRSHCLACCRCFWSCPVERERLDPESH